MSFIQHKCWVKQFLHGLNQGKWKNIRWHHPKASIQPGVEISLKNVETTNLELRLLFFKTTCSYVMYYNVMLYNWLKTCSWLMSIWRCTCQKGWVWGLCYVERVYTGQHIEIPAYLLVSDPRLYWLFFHRHWLGRFEQHKYHPTFETSKLWH